MSRSMLLFGLGILGAVACGSSAAPPLTGTSAGESGASQCGVGDEGCTCYANQTCNGTLSCFSSLCVNASGTGIGGGASSTGGASDGGANAAGAGAGGTTAVDMTSAGSSAAGASSAGANAAGASSGGATSVGGANAAGASAGGATSAGGSTGAPPNLYLVDDFADCNAQIIEVDGRKGNWFDLSSTPQTFKVGSPPTLSWLDQSCGVFLTGYCPTCSAAGIGVILAPGSYDLSRFSGIRVTFESGATLFVRVKATNGSSYTYATSNAVVPTGGETVATVLFASMTQDPGFQGFSLADEIHFTVSTYDKANGFGVGIHRLELLP